MRARTQEGNKVRGGHDQKNVEELIEKRLKAAMNTSLNSHPEI